jgi:hypothetical protein
MDNQCKTVEESYIYENHPVFWAKPQLIPGNKWMLGTSL